MTGAVFMLLAIVVSVMIHELGHYLAAKATGMKVTEFFFGFGPRIWSTRRGETEYGVKALPFGGYVRIVGMNPLEEVAPEDHGRTYREKPFWAKSLVVLAGVALNIVLAYLLFFVVLAAYGVLEPQPVVREVVAEIDGTPTPAALAGLQPGDRIVAVDGRAVGSWEELVESLAARPGETVTLTIDRDGARTDLVVELAAIEREDGTTVGFLGVAPEFEAVRVPVGEAVVDAGRVLVRGVGITFSSLARLVHPDSLVALAKAMFGAGEVPVEVRPVSPVGLVQIGAQMQSEGFDTLLWLVAQINIILAIFNALPLYPLDGGHFAVALYEKLTRREANVEKLLPVAAAVIGLLVFLGIAAIVLDIIDPIVLPQ